MEGKRKETPFPLQSLVPSCELSLIWGKGEELRIHIAQVLRGYTYLGDGEGVAEVEATVHVRVRKGDKVLALLVGHLTILHAK